MYIHPSLHSLSHVLRVSHKIFGSLYVLYAFSAMFRRPGYATTTGRVFPDHLITRLRYSTGPPRGGSHVCVSFSSHPLQAYRQPSLSNTLASPTASPPMRTKLYFLFRSIARGCGTGRDYGFAPRGPSPSGRRTHSVPAKGAAKAAAHARPKHRGCGETAALSGSGR